MHINSCLEELSQTISTYIDGDIQTINLKHARIRRNNNHHRVKAGMSHDNYITQVEEAFL